MRSVQISVCVFCVCLSASVCNAQSVKADATGAPPAHIRPMSGHDYEVPLPWGGLKAMVVTGEVDGVASNDPKLPFAERRFYYLPLFLFKKDDKGRIDVSQKGGVIQLRLIMDRDDVKDIVVKYLVGERLLAPNVSKAQVMPIDADAYWIQTPDQYSPKIKFGVVHNPTFSSDEETVYASASEADAKRFIDDLQTDHAALRAVIAYRGYGYLQNSATITWDDISRTTIYRSIDGNGRPVSRKQMSDMLLEACLSRGVEVEKEFDDPDFGMLLKEAMNAMTSQRLELRDWESLDGLFKSNGWREDDLRADVVKLLEDHASGSGEDSSKWARSMSDASSGKGNGGISLTVPKILSLGLNGSGESDARASSALQQELQAKWGVDSDVKYDSGTIRFIPKSISALRNDFEGLHSRSVYKVGDKKKFLANGFADLPLNPQMNFLTFSTTDSVEELRAQVAQLYKQAADLERELVEARSSLNTAIAALRPLSIGGESRGGGSVMCPDGTTTKDWNILLSLRHFGVTDELQEHDNAALWVNIYPRERSDHRGWEVVTEDHFRYMDTDRDKNPTVTDRPVSYLLTRKN